MSFHLCSYPVSQSLEAAHLPWFPSANRFPVASQWWPELEVPSEKSNKSKPLSMAQASSVLQQFHIFPSRSRK